MSRIKVAIAIDVRGKVELPSLDYLVALCAKAHRDAGLRLAA